MSHGINLEYLRTMANKANTKADLKEINRRIECVFDASFNYGLLDVKTFRHLYSKWIDIHTDKALTLNN